MDMRSVAAAVKEAGGIRLADGAAGCITEWRECRRVLGKAGIGVFAPARRASALPPDVMAEHLGYDSDSDLLAALLDEHHRPGLSQRAMMDQADAHEEWVEYQEAQERLSRTIWIDWSHERRCWVAKDENGDEVAATWDAHRMLEIATKHELLLGAREETW